jgi:putative transposase
VAKRPDRPFGTVSAFRPGEWTQIDSTPLNVRVVLDTGETDRVELTWMIDLATRTIPAAVLRPTTKAADAAVLLAKAMTPEPMRPGWVDALRMSRSVLPHRRLTELDERLEHRPWYWWARVFNRRQCPKESSSLVTVGDPRVSVEVACTDA